MDLTTILGDFAEAIGVPPVMALSHIFRKNLLKQFKSRLRCAPVIPNADQVLINFSNGTLEINNGNERMRGFCKDDRLTYQLPFAMDKDAKCPMFDRFLNQVLPDSSSRDVIAEFFGWPFIRGLKLEVALLLYGDGANGKSVIFDVVRAMLGKENVTNIGLSMLSTPENRIMLASSLLNYASEFDGKCNSGTFKKMVSGEPLEARHRYRDPFVMNDYARLAFNVNELPKDIEHTHGFFRRFLIVPFPVTISEEEMDPNLARKIIAAELPGVFNWVMQGMRRLLANQKFTECLAAKESLDAYRTESDTIAMFLTDQCLVPSENHKVAKGTLYQDYRRYCTSSGLKSLAKNEFGRRMTKQHGIPSRKSGSTHSWMLEVRDQPED
jgi:putative DNA primase/helicase